MEIETENAVEHFFPSSSFSQVYLEAVANALDAAATEIFIRVTINSFTTPSSLLITIADNGFGFTDESFLRFRRLLKAQDPFHKGLGRLIYLKYFRSVEIDSHFKGGRRKFSFTKQFDWKKATLERTADEIRDTTLTFSGFTGEKVKSYDDLRPSAIRDRLIQEFLPRLYELQQQGQSLLLSITVETQQGNPEHDFFNDTQIFKLDQLPVLKEIKIQDDALDMFAEIVMTYRIEECYGKNPIVTAACVDMRTIPLDLIPQGSIPSNYSIVCLFYSDFFKGKSDSSRQSLEMSDEASAKTLLAVLRRNIARIIAEEIPAVEKKNQFTKNEFVEQFPHLLGYFEPETVGIIQRDEALEIAQKRFFKDQKEILESDHLDEVKFQKSLEVSSRTLTEYILYRNLIIKKLGEINPTNSEADIHNLIIPRYQTIKSSDLARSVYSNNAWLLDDKFMTFSTILSEERMDKLIGEITLSDEHKPDETRPDISIIFSNDPEVATKVDVVVVEIKRQTDDEKDNYYAILQLLQRAEKLIENCPNIQRIWYYAVLQINDAFARRLAQQDYVPLFSRGKVFYREAATQAPDGRSIPTPIFVLSFDAIISDAECRNSTFLNLLKSELKQMTSVKN